MDSVDVVKTILAQQTDAFEKYALEYFGDYETASAFGQYFVIETSDMHIESVNNPMTDEYKILAEIDYRLRVRTPEELEKLGIQGPYPESIVMLQDVEAEREILRNSQNPHGL